MIKMVRGITLIELVILILIISIMGIVLATRINPVAPARLVSAGEKLIADLNHAGRLAMSEHRRYAVVFNGNSYTIGYLDTENGNENGVQFIDVPCPHTGREWYGTDFSEDGINLSADFNQTQQLQIGSFGKPFDGNGNELIEDGQITLEYRGNTFRIKVVPETGSVIREK